jgi:hypothetical protein
MARVRGKIMGTTQIRRMGMILLIGTLLLAQPLPAAARGGEEAPPSASPAIGFQIAGALDSGLVQRVRLWLWKNLAPIREAQYLEPTGSNAWSAAELVARAVDANPAETLCTLFLIADPAPRPLAEASFVTNGVALVYPFALATPQASPETNASQWMRRVEKESLHAAGLALGLPDCVFPLCGMHRYTTEQELDTKAANLCPPCFMRLEGILSGKGVPLDWMTAPPSLPAGSGSSRRSSPIGLCRSLLSLSGRRRIDD